jgi:hypothetical protein
MTWLTAMDTLKTRIGDFDFLLIKIFSFVCISNFLCMNGYSRNTEARLATDIYKLYEELPVDILHSLLVSMVVRTTDIKT